MAVELTEDLMDRALILARKRFSDQPPGFPFDEDLDPNTVKLPPEVERQLHEDVEEEGQDALADLTEESGFESVIGRLSLSRNDVRQSDFASPGWILVVDHLPIVAPDKIEKLTSLIKKIFSSVGSVREGVYPCHKRVRLVSLVMDRWVLYAIR